MRLIMNRQPGQRAALCEKENIFSKTERDKRDGCGLTSNDVGAGWYLSAMTQQKRDLWVTLTDNEGANLLRKQLLLTATHHFNDLSECTVCKTSQSELIGKTPHHITEH